MNKAPAFQFYARDFIADMNVVAMSNEALGAYVRLLCHDWMENGLPNDDAILAALSGTRERWPEVREQVLKCFNKTGGKKSKLVNPHLQSQRKQHRELRAKRRQSGKQGANARWGKKDERESTAKTKQTANEPAKAQPTNELSGENEYSTCHGEPMANDMAKHSSAVCSLHTADKEIDSSPPTPLPDVGSGCAEFEARLLPSYQAVLDAWREERGKAELAYVPDPQTKDGAARLATMIERGDTAEGDVRKAMANLLSDTEARERYTLKGLANNLSIWIDGGKRGGKGGNGRPRRGGPPDQGELLSKGAKAFEGL